MRKGSGTFFRGQVVGPEASLRQPRKKVPDPGDSRFLFRRLTCYGYPFLYPGPPSYFSPYHIHSLPDGPPGEYLTDRLTNEALGYVESHQHEPFFLCLWHYAVHAPFQAKRGFIDRYRGKRDPRGRQDCPTMAVMIQSEDESLGRVLDKLDELDLTDRTIIILMSDNGGNMYDRVEGTTPTNNAPLRGGKATLYEGGTRVPCIIVWPGVVRPGSRSAEIISSIDFFPTMLQMAHIEPRRQQPVDGTSIVPVLTGAGALERTEIFCHFPHYIPATDALPGTFIRPKFRELPVRRCCEYE